MAHVISGIVGATPMHESAGTGSDNIIAFALGCNTHVPVHASTDQGSLHVCLRLASSCFTCSLQLILCCAVQCRVHSCYVIVHGPPSGGHLLHKITRCSQACEGLYMRIDMWRFYAHVQLVSEIFRFICVLYLTVGCLLQDWLHTCLYAVWCVRNPHKI